MNVTDSEISSDHSPEKAGLAVSSSTNGFAFQTPETEHSKWRGPQRELYDSSPSASMGVSGVASLSKLMRSPAAIFSDHMATIPPPPPIRTTSSSSWFSDYDDPFDAPGVPAMKLALPSPTAPETPKPPLRQRKSAETEFSEHIENEFARMATNKTSDPRTTYDARAIDVYCRPPPARDSRKLDGTVFYHDLIDTYGKKLRKESENENMGSKGLVELTRSYSKQVVETMRGRGARFLCKKRRADVQFYDIGDQGAIRKTIRLLKRYVQQRTPSTMESNQKAGISHEYDERIHNQLRGRKKRNEGPELENVFQLLSIPTRNDSKDFAPIDKDEGDENIPPSLVDTKLPPFLPVDLPEEDESMHGTAPSSSSSQPLQCSFHLSGIPDAASLPTPRPTSPLLFDPTDLRLPGYYQGVGHHNDVTASLHKRPTF